MAETPGRPKTEHDVEYEKQPSTGGERPKVPDPSNIEQGSKNPDVRDKGDKTDHPSPRK
jgi:hypothetical protein